MSGDGTTPVERNIVNRLAALQAGQEQMHRDVEKVKATTAATVITCAYVLGVLCVIYFVIRTRRAPA